LSGRYADRPANTCLTSILLSTDPATAAVAVRGVRDGARVLLAEAASWTGSAA
jgi:dTDP-4-dehydrorhamnose reductase